jgi:hypothetical protein
MGRDSQSLAFSTRARSVLSLSRNVATMASARTAFASIPSIAPQPAPRVLLDSDRKDRWPAGPKRADTSRAPTLTTRSIKSKAFVADPKINQ